MQISFLWSKFLAELYTLRICSSKSWLRYLPALTIMDLDRFQYDKSMQIKFKSIYVVKKVNKKKIESILNRFKMI